MKKIIRSLAIILNILGFILIFILLVNDPLNFESIRKGWVLLVVLLLLILPIINMIITIRNITSWLSLYLQRKTLEEKKKINALLTEASVSSDTNDTKNVS